MRQAPHRSRRRRAQERAKRPTPSPTCAVPLDSFPHRPVRATRSPEPSSPARAPSDDLGRAARILPNGFRQEFPNGNIFIIKKLSREHFRGEIPMPQTRRAPGKRPIPDPHIHTQAQRLRMKNGERSPSPRNTLRSVSLCIPGRLGLGSRRFGRPLARRRSRLPAVSIRRA